MPDLYYSERNLLDAARAGKVITAAEIEVLTDRLVRVRAKRDRLHEALVRIAAYAEWDRPDDWKVNQIRDVAALVLDAQRRPA